MRPDFNGIRIAPSIPKDWERLTINKTFRGKRLRITVENPGKKESGFTEFYVNGESFTSNYIPQEKLTDITEVRIVM